MEDAFYSEGHFTCFSSFFPHNEGKGNSVSEADQQRFTDAYNSIGMSKENVRYLLDKGNKEMTIEGSLVVPETFYEIKN